MFQGVIQFNAAKLQQGQGSGLGLWSEWQSYLSSPVYFRLPITCKLSLIPSSPVPATCVYLVAKGIMDLHNGIIGVESAGEGFGCCFFVELPLLSQAGQSHSVPEDGPLAQNSREDAVVTVFQQRPSMFLPASTVAMTSVRRSIPEGDRRPDLQEEYKTDGRLTAGGTRRFRDRDAPETQDSSLSMSDDSASSVEDGSRPNAVAPSPLGSSRNLPLEGYSGSLGGMRNKRGEKLIPTGASFEEEIPSLPEVNEVGDHRKALVLVVDDSSPCRTMTKRAVASQAECIDEASDGLEAVNLVVKSIKAKKVYDIIFMDNLMPNLDGPSAARVIRAKGYKGLIVGVTGHMLKEDVERFLAHGADKVLAKPVNIAAFHSCMEGMNALFFLTPYVVVVTTCRLLFYVLMLILFVEWREQQERAPKKTFLSTFGFL